MTGSIAVSQCGHTPYRPGHHGTVVARTVGTVAISCNGGATEWSPFPGLYLLCPPSRPRGGALLPI